MDSSRRTGVLPPWVSPFGNPRIKACLRLPEAYRSLPRPSSPSRYPERRNLIRHLLPTRPYLRQVGGQPYFNLVGFARLQIKKVQRAKLLIHDRAWSGRRRLEVQTVVGNLLLHAFGGWIVAEQTHRPVPIRQEIDPAAGPHRIVVVGILARNFLDARIRQGLHRIAVVGIL